MKATVRQSTPPIVVVVDLEGEFPEDNHYMDNLTFAVLHKQLTIEAQYLVGEKLRLVLKTR